MTFSNTYFGKKLNDSNAFRLFNMDVCGWMIIRINDEIITLQIIEPVSYLFYERFCLVRQLDSIKLFVVLCC